MDHSFKDLLALAALMLWPAIPLLWIPVHCAPRFFRRLSFLTYVLPLITWLPLSIVTFELREILLQHRSALPAAANIIGICLFVTGALLQAWTLSLLTLPGITGMPEVTRSIPGRLRSAGPFSVVRHPTYLSHTFMLLGVFLATGVTAVGIATAVDAIAVNTMVIPLEERELLERFGAEYEEYRRNVPSRILPLPRARSRK